MFVQAFPKECTETFMEGHRRAFEELGGVPRRISYDNSAIAVIEVLKGRERKLTREFLRLQSHYLFAEHFCLVRRANEKGHVERLLGTARRRFLVPVPEVDSGPSSSHVGDRLVWQLNPEPAPLVSSPWYAHRSLSSGWIFRPIISR
jgi:transposase